MTTHYHFVTFGDCRLDSALRRIARQAREMQVFSLIECFNETRLDPLFVSEFKDRLIPGSRGFGYWVWKPQVVLQMLDGMQDGDILLYADAGCHLNVAGRNRLQEYFEMLNEKGHWLLATQLSNNSPDAHWTKGDVFDHFECRHDPEVTLTGQIAATSFLIKKCPESEAFIQSWLNVFRFHWELADDSLSSSPNLPGFRENRHDQSIFSILAKRNQALTIPSSECSAKDWKTLDLFPIQFRRDKGIRKLPVWKKILDKGTWQRYRTKLEKKIRETRIRVKN